MEGDHYIAELHIDPDSLPVTSPEMEHERRVAIFDLLEENEFKPAESPSGPYVVTIFLQDDRLLLKIIRTNGAERGDCSFSIKPFRRVVKDYFMICEAYHDAIRTSTSAQIEAIDMGRRGLHNEGSRMFSDALRNTLEIDFNTSRRFFTLLCALHRRPK